MRTTRMTKIAMVIFLFMIFFLGVQRPVLAAERNTTVRKYQWNRYLKRTIL